MVVNPFTEVCHLKCFMSILLIWVSCHWDIQLFSYSSYTCIFSFIFSKNKFWFIYILILYDLISLRFKAGPVENRHDKIILHEIFMLHIHIIIYVIHLWWYMWPLMGWVTTIITKIALILYVWLMNGIDYRYIFGMIAKLNSFSYFYKT